MLERDVRERERQLQQEFLSHTTKIINQFQQRGCNRSLVEQHFDKAKFEEREQLLIEKKNETATSIPLSLKYNRILPKIKEIVMKHWHLLHINPNLMEIFQNPPILAFCQNRNLRDIIGTKLIENGKVKRKFTSKIQVNVHHAQPTREPCAVNKSYIQQRLEVTEPAEYFRSITT